MKQLTADDSDMRWKNCFSVLLLVVLVGTVSAQLAPTTAPTTKPHNFARWEKEIVQYEQMDREHPPAKGGNVFVGASSVRRWKTMQADFPGYNVINRGVGGSEIVDATHFADRIIFPYEPKVVLLRAGGNDIHGGKTPQQTLADYKEFVAKIREKLPDATIVFISQNAAPKRWDEREKDRQLNEMVEDYTKQTPGLKYIEIWDIVLNADGTANESMFVEDKLHPSEAAYKLMAERIKKVLVK